MAIVVQELTVCEECVLSCSIWWYLLNMSLRISYFSIRKAYNIMQMCALLHWSDLKTDLAYVNSPSEGVFFITNRKHCTPNYLALDINTRKLNIQIVFIAFRLSDFETIWACIYPTWQLRFSIINLTIYNPNNSFLNIGF